MDARGWRTEHLAIGYNFAEIGKGILVAKEYSVAKVTIFQGLAVGILLAVTIDGISRALALAAFVSDGARVTIVTFGQVGGEDTAARVIARIIGAGVVIIALHRGPDANTIVTVIRHGTGVSILAFVVADRGMLTTGLALARIGGAIVTVVTKIDILPFDKGSFVHISITVIVDSVADLLGRVGSIAITYSGFTADPFADT